MSLHIAAIRRYAAFTGELKEMSQAEHAQAFVDRIAFGSQYMPRKCRGYERAGLLARFMQEVCAIPLWQARECLIAILQADESYRLEWLRPASNLATQIMNETGNIFVAEETASLYLAAAEGTKWARIWREVLEALRYGVFVDLGEGSSGEDTPKLH